MPPQNQNHTAAKMFSICPFVFVTETDACSIFRQLFVEYNVYNLELLIACDGQATRNTHLVHICE
jgi:hypothetical protein